MLLGIESTRHPSWVAGRLLYGQYPAEDRLRSASSELPVKLAAFVQQFVNR